MPPFMEMEGVGAFLIAFLCGNDSREETAFFMRFYNDGEDPKVLGYQIGKW